jgi:RND superfamily putative drug exporter
VAIAIDATIVRCLAVPAVMTFMARAAWWLPGWLQRVLPPISIEGGDFFDRKDAEKRQPQPEPAVSG